MRALFRIVFTISALCLFLPNTYALTGQNIYEDCQYNLKVFDPKNPPKESVPSLDAMKAGGCIGYLKGLDDMQLFYTAIFTDFSKDESQIKKYLIYCLPENGSSNDLANAIVKYGQTHPEELKKPAISFALKALRDTYPCK